MTTIGILAGMGPRSTAPFVDRVVSTCRALYGARDDMDFPPMMIYSLPTPFYPDRPLDHEAMLTAITGGLERLAATGVAFIAIPCNTAHLYYDELAADCSVPLLNMLEETVDALPESADSVAVFGTRPTIEAGFYQTTLARRGKGWVVAPDWQQRIDDLLEGLKQGEAQETLDQSWRDLLEDADEAGADTVIMACSDLSAITSKNPPIHILDATSILARTTVRRWRELEKMK